jgi:transcriptional regulator of arginine metabolism
MRILMHMDKNRRHRAIIRALRSGPLVGQESLRRVLAESGIEATQATISRDMKEIGVVKTPQGYMLPDALADQHAPVVDRALELSISTFLVAADIAGTIVVVKTEPGHAQALAAALDRAGLKRVVGSIAGDDTIFLATRSAKDAAWVLKALQRLAAGQFGPGSNAPITSEFKGGWS